MPAVANISAYRFAPLADLKPLREKLRALCEEEGLKGTILLSTEGINLFVAGDRAAVDRLVAAIRLVPGLEGLSPKYSESGTQPFSRMLVRIKKEIIAFGVAGIEPGAHTSPKLPARELKKWLDEGRPVTLLDTRNEYEVKLGTFKGAVDLGIGHFRDFPEAVRTKLPATTRDQTIVMFCTGGIRCEKAGPLMEREGFANVFQLEGGILKYFEECGGAHFDGECFVFDQRVGVDPALRETASAQCYVCQTPLTPTEQSDPRYVIGESCPYCFRTSDERMREDIARREKFMERMADPLPGSVPYENRRPFLIPPGMDGLPLVDAACTIFPHHSREDWMELCARGRVLDGDGTPVASDSRVRSGRRYEVVQPDVVEPPVNARIHLIHEDEAVIVVDKPAPLPVHPSGRFNKNTLQFFLAAAYAPQHPRPAHRLDAGTTGIMVWTRTRHFAKLIQPQFERGTVEKRYLARVHGHPAADTFRCEAPISSEPGPIGSRSIDPDDGLPALTEFRLLERRPDGTSLVEAIPRTGRTNQIRVHLCQLGLPIVGDSAYLPDQEKGRTLTDTPDKPSLCLHASSLTFEHPLTRQAATFASPPPPWAVHSGGGL